MYWEAVAGARSLNFSPCWGKYGNESEGQGGRFGQPLNQAKRTAGEPTGGSLQAAAVQRMSGPGAGTE